MPFVNIEMIAGRTEDQKAALATAITEAFVKHGGVAPESVWIAFNDHQKDNFAIGGTLVARRPPKA